MSDGVIATDEAGRVILMNRRAGEMLGVEGEELAGHDIVSLLGLEESNRRRWRAKGHDSKALEIVPREARTVHDACDLYSDSSAGNRHHRYDCSSARRYGAGEAGSVAAGVRGECIPWRTPLTTIKSYTEALEDGALEDKQMGPRFVGVIQNETGRMIRLVTDLHLSRLDSKEAALHKEPTDIVEMLEDVEDRFSFQMKQKHIRTIIEVKPGVSTAMLDRDGIDQVLDNLISNAQIYARRRHYHHGCKHNGGRHAVLIGKDTGIGIPKKDLDRIFERFYRVDKARTRNLGGTGLGLSIAREIVRAHGGFITLQSELEKGTTVTFTLPLDNEGGR